jgi:Kdo2-lipid A phosphotransferase
MLKTDLPLNSKTDIKILNQQELKWNLNGLLIANSLAILLLLSWFFEPTHSLWQRLDDWFFWYFNNSLRNGPDNLRFFWALVNVREFDRVVALALLGIFAVHALKFGKQYWGRHAGMLLTLIVVLGVWTGYGTLTGIGQLLPIERISATLQYEESFRLSDWSTEVKTKDSSSDSFPGDHGMILMITAGFMAYYFSKGFAWIAVLLAIACTMPRVVSGAHWMTDEIVGALFIAMLALSWNFHTPAGEYMVRATDKIVSRILNV